MTTNADVQYKEIPTKENAVTDTTEVSYGYGVRHIQVFLAFLSMSVLFVARAHMGVTIVAMTNRPVVNNSSLNNTQLKYSGNLNETTVWEDLDYENTTMAVDDFEENQTSHLITDPPGMNGAKLITTYDWPKSTQEMILGSFFLGYSIMMFPMGMVCQKWGGKLPIQIALTVNGLISLVAPWIVEWGGWKAVCACRMIQGLTQAGLFPSLQTIIATWSHSSEMGKFISYVYTGTTFGTVVAFQIGGFLSASRWGWPSIFWATGAICFLMFVIFTIFGTKSPYVHKRISEDEKKYILGNKNIGGKKNRKVPWKAVLTSKHVWANVATHVGSGISFIFFFNQVPSYIHYILDVDVKKSGLLSSLPYIFSFFTNILFGFLSDFATNRKILSVANTRRVSNSIAALGTTFCFIVVSFTKNVELAVSALVCSLSLSVAIHTGWMLNHIDLAPTFSGTLMAFGNTIICSLSLLVPVFVSLIITDVKNQIQWRIMFVAMAALAFITNAIFVIFMSADTQPWNDLGDDKNDKEKDKEENDAQTRI